MNAKENTVLERLAVSSLEKCLVRLSKVSAGTWQLLDTAGASGTPGNAVGKYDFRNQPAAAVYFDIKGDFPMTSLMIFDPADIDCISKCFLGYSFPRQGGISQSDEVMLLELGNIVLNSLSNSVFNALGESFMPSVPQFVAGDALRIAESVRAVAGAALTFNIVASTIAIQCDNRVSRSKVIALVPEQLALALARTKV
ncbi:MAG: hypothetical protein Q8O90_06355 [Elusimicrobiota bacterium]|nr:hypothetical protein [Elusimicrobiota bacterium]